MVKEIQLPSPPVLLLGAPALVGPLRAAGVVVLGEGPPGRDYTVVVGRLTSELVPVVQAQIGQGRTVVLLAGATEELSSPPPNVRVLRLPVTVDELLDVIDAKPVGGVVGTAEVGVDYSVHPTKARDALGLFHGGTGKASAPPVASRPPVGSVAAPTSTPQENGAPAQRGPEPLPAEKLEPVHRPAVAKVPGEWDLRAPAAEPAPSVRPGPLGIYDELEVDHSAPPAPTVTARVPEQPAPFVMPQPSPTSVRPAQGPQPAPVGAFRPPTAQRMGALIICFAGKGGVGKSSLTLALGEQASSLGLRSIVVDANRGQGDLRKYLRVNQAYLPSVVDAATSGDPERAITTPERLAAARPAGLPVPAFATVLAPTDTQVDPSLVTPEVYREVVDAVRGLADLVVVDTQIVEATDIGGMVDEFMIPLLISGAWGLGISDPSVGADNLLRRLYMLNARGVKPDRLMVCLNRVEPSSGLNQDAMARLVEPYATWMGAIGIDPKVTTAFESGAIPTSPAIEELLGRVLERVTGISPVARAKPPEAPKRGLFRWKKK